MNQHHDKQTIDAAQATAIQLQDQAPGMSRRKFLTRTGVGSLPVIMSLQSGSAWGCVDLECKSGKTSMSNSGSAVASATSTVGGREALYEKPNWSSISVIKQVLTVDFDRYLLATYNTPLYKKVRDNVKKKYTYNLISTANYGSWWTSVNGECYSGKKNYQGKWVYSRFYTPRKPAVYGDNNGTTPYSGKILVSGTKFSDIFSGGTSSTFSSCLDQYDSLEQYLVAAFIGSVWERHPEYTNQYKGRKICYPTPEELISAYDNAKGRYKGLDDLKSLLALYTIDE